MYNIYTLMCAGNYILPMCMQIDQVHSRVMNKTTTTTTSTATIIIINQPHRQQYHGCVLLNMFIVASKCVKVKYKYIFNQ